MSGRLKTVRDSESQKVPDSVLRCSSFMGNMYTFFSRLIGTLAVILLVSAFIGSTSLLKKLIENRKTWKFVIIIGLAGGLFGIYGNISGFDLNGAVISVRDIGPMLSGLMGGPVSGLLAGAIAGFQRYSMGGITAQACVVATCIIGLLCGAISAFYHDILKKSGWVLLIGAVMESLHLGIVLLMVTPFSTAWNIVRQIAVPFVTVNAVGIALMTVIMHFFDKQREMTLERERMKSELEVANVIQNSLLPALSDRYPGRPELKVSASMQAAKTVGGDFYDVFFIDDDQIVFLIGDVSGKGVPAALFMACSKVILQNCVRMTPDLSEGIALANDVLCRGNDADMFVTVWAGILDIRSGELIYVSAGHNPPVLVRDGTPEFMKSKGSFVLGGMENMAYSETGLRLKNGDKIFLYTDGVTEAVTKDNESFGNDRLLECLKDCAEEGPGKTLEKVKSSLNGFVRDNEQFDDITMLCFEWHRQA